MWNSFEGALEKRVRRTKKIEPDKFIILRCTKKILGSLFGSAGRENILVVDYLNGKIKLKIAKSIWKSEISLQKERVIALINQEIGQNQIQGIIIEN